MNESAEYSVTASDMLEYLYCPRYTYFEHVLGISQNEDKRFKVQKGREVHEEVRKVNPNYLRKKIGQTGKESDVYLSSKDGMKGIVDEILFLNDGTAAPLDYKYAQYEERLYKTYKYQLVFYSKMIKENYNVDVLRGFLIYTRSQNKLIEVEITPADFIELDEILKNIKLIIQGCNYPNATKTIRKCDDCCYKNICEKQI
ncbi:MAG: CRISPR-associated protein Cas4 [Desulfamplus sp.]|nr:CRISPR-associated protein Cas4 [Desulfamplus sp.]